LFTPTALPHELLLLKELQQRGLRVLRDGRIDGRGPLAYHLWGTEVELQGGAS
jgi:hypothetical protein